MADELQTRPDLATNAPVATVEDRDESVSTVEDRSEPVAAAVTAEERNGLDRNLNQSILDGINELKGKMTSSLSSKGFGKEELQNIIREAFDNLIKAEYNKLKGGLSEIKIPGKQKEINMTNWVSLKSLDIVNILKKDVVNNILIYLSNFRKDSINIKNYTKPLCSEYDNNFTLIKSSPTGCDKYGSLSGSDHILIESTIIDDTALMELVNESDNIHNIIQGAIISQFNFMVDKTRASIKRCQGNGLIKRININSLDACIKSSTDETDKKILEVYRGMYHGLKSGYTMMVNDFLDNELLPCGKSDGLTDCKDTSGRQSEWYKEIKSRINMLTTKTIDTIESSDIVDSTLNKILKDPWVLFIIISLSTVLLFILVSNIYLIFKNRSSNGVPQR